MKFAACALPIVVLSMVVCELPPCSDKVTMEDFDFSLFHGRWNVLMGTAVTRPIACIQQIIQDESQNSSVIIFKGLLNNNEMGKNEGVIWKTDSPGKLQFNISEPTWSFELPYWVLDTDYDNYAVAYSCFPVQEHRERTMVLGRNTSLSDEATATVSRVLERNNFTLQQMIHVAHSDCPSNE